jgi:hypothetical protein
VTQRYQRRIERVDEATRGMYLSRTDTSRLHRALGPLLGGVPLSKDAVWRAWWGGCGRTSRDGRSWIPASENPLRASRQMYPRVRIGKKRVRVPVLDALGVCADGRRMVLLDRRLAGLDSEQAWLDAVRSLAARNLGALRLAVIDGNPGLATVLRP